MTVHPLKKHIEKLIDKGKMWDNAGMQIQVLAVSDTLEVSNEGFIEQVIFIKDNKAEFEPEVILESMPAAGAEVSITVPAGETWELHSLLLSLVTDANIANRTIKITFSDGTTVFFNLIDSTAQVASETIERQYARNLLTISSGNNRMFELPKIILIAGSKISTITTGIQVGDQYGTPTLYVTKLVKSETESTYRLSVDNAPIINELSLFDEGSYHIDFNKNQFPISKGNTIKFERLQGNISAKIIILIKNAQLKESWKTSEELVKE